MPEPAVDNMLRVRTDPLFYAILGTIGGTYVVLIIAKCCLGRRAGDECK